MTPTELIRKVRELCAQASPGPWTASPWNTLPNGYLYGPRPMYTHEPPQPGLLKAIPPQSLRSEDAEFIAESRQLLPQLADLCESLLTTSEFFDGRADDFGDHLKKRATELAADYPFTRKDAFEYLWALTSTLEGTELANQDCHKKIAELMTEIENLKSEARNADQDFKAVIDRNRQLTAALTEATERMTRARSILTNGSPTETNNWGMLDAGNLIAALNENRPAK